MSRTISCRDAAASFDEYCDGVLPPGRRQTLATHLRECRECTQVVRDLRCARRLLRRLPREPMPDDMKDNLLHKLRRSRTSPEPARHANQPGPSEPPNAATATRRTPSDSENT
jgi:anti-sigma factor RsiW